ncbi:MAG: hypothetical protein L0154_30050 [Chloroflexi bacterium]|nr:hypothetical protein [Chloroflexota bacterium]
MQQFSFLEDLGFRAERGDIDRITLYSSPDLYIAFIDNDGQLTVEILPIVESHIGEWRDFFEVTGWSVSDKALPDAIRQFIQMDNRPLLEAQEFIPLLFFRQAEAIFEFLVEDYGLTYDNPLYGFNHRNGHSLHFTDGDTRHVSIIFASGRASIQIKWDGAEYNIEREIRYDDTFLESMAYEVEQLLLKSS